jgi:hypothetical protein
MYHQWSVDTFDLELHFRCAYVPVCLDTNGHCPALAIVLKPTLRKGGSRFSFGSVSRVVGKLPPIGVMKISMTELDDRENTVQ